MRMKSKSDATVSQGPPQPQLPAEDRDQLDLGPGQVDGGRHDEQVAEGGRLDHVFDRDVVKDHVVDRGVEVAALMPSPVVALPWGSRSTTRTR